MGFRRNDILVNTRASESQYARAAMCLTVLAIALFPSLPAARAQSGQIVVWGSVPPWFVPPSGVYSTVSVGSEHALALRPDGTMVGWGGNGFGQATPQPGTFTAVAAGADHSVALRTDGTAISWGNNFEGEANTPPGTFLQVSAGYHCSGGLRPDGSIVIWGLWETTPVPPGTFKSVWVGGDGNLGAIRADNTMVTWVGAPAAISGTFKSINVNCLAAALRADGSVVTFGGCLSQNYPAPPGQFVQLSASSSGYHGALRPDGTIAVWGPHPPSVLNVPSGPFSFVAMGPGFGMAIKSCYVNCDNSSVSPMLNANDFQCFLNKFAAGNTEANCDGNTSGVLLTANDFQCFINKFAAGCP